MVLTLTSLQPQGTGLRCMGGARRDRDGRRHGWHLSSTRHSNRVRC